MANTDQEIAPLSKNDDQPSDSSICIPEDLEPGPGCCIYEVPSRFREANQKAFTPQLISIGPIHHGNTNFARMERQKQMYYEKFQRKTSKKTLKDFKSYIQRNVRRIGRCYDAQSVYMLEAPELVEIVLHDAVFIIMLFLRDWMEKQGYITNDEEEGDYYDFPFLRVKLLTDLMLIENQLPFFVLEDLYKLAFPNSYQHSFLDLACSYFSVKESPSFDKRKIKHFTDLIRYQVLRACPLETRSYVGNHNMHSATKLREADVQFRYIVCKVGSGESIGVMFNGVSCNCYKIGDYEYEDVDFIDDVPESAAYGLLQVRFDKRVLELLTIDVEYETEIRFRNLMAFEQYHYPKEAYFCSYIKLLDSFVDTDEDVNYLVEKGIIVNKLGSNKAVADMINNLAVGVVHSTMLYGEIGMKLNERYKSSWNRGWAKLKHVYFNDLWRGTATVAAFIVVMLTLIQTVLAILDKATPHKIKTPP